MRHRTPTPSRVAWLVVALPLIAACVLRLLAWWTLPYRGQISDEAEYLAAASWLADGRGFSFYKDWIWTRPPVYLLFVAAHIKLFGVTNVVPIRLSQALISMITVALAMVWGYVLAPAGRGRRVALVTGWLMALSYSFATYAYLVLSETIFVALLLVGLLLLTLWSRAQSTANERGSRWWLLAGGGIALGLGALTRALLAGAMPLFACWVLWQAIRTPAENGRASRSQMWRGLRSAALFTVVVSGVILPWTYYNSRFFSAGQARTGMILIDTTGAYNAILGVQAGRNETRVYEKLIQIPDQAARQTFAYAEAWRSIRADPSAFLRKTGSELLDLITINYGGAERLRSGHTQGMIPIPHLLLLLWDDTLYFAIAPLAVLGLLRRQGHTGKGLAVSWLGYNMVTGPLFFAITRFRVPILPILFVYAACAFVQWGEPWQGRVRRRFAYALTALILLLILPSYVYVPQWLEQGASSTLQNTYLGIRGRIAAWDCERSDAALRAGDLDAAQRFVDRGSAYRIGNNGLDCFALLQARLDIEHKNFQQGLALLQSMKRLPERFLLEGEIYQMLGDKQRAFGALVARELEIANPTGWAWRNLSLAPATRIDLGSGFDWGAIDGFYTREGAAEKPNNYRWSSGRALLRFSAAGTGVPQTLRLRVTDGRSPDQTPPKVTIGLVCASADCDATARSVAVPHAWQVIDVPLAPTPVGQDVIVEIQSTTFVPGPRDLQIHQHDSQPLRLLGIQVDWAEVVP